MVDADQLPSPIQTRLRRAEVERWRRDLLIQLEAEQAQREIPAAAPARYIEPIRWWFQRRQRAR